MHLSENMMAKGGKVLTQSSEYLWYMHHMPIPITLELTSMN